MSETLFKKNDIPSTGIISSESDNLVGICAGLSLCSGVRDASGKIIAEDDLIFDSEHSAPDNRGKGYPFRVRYNGEFWSIQVGDSTMQDQLLRANKHRYFVVGNLRKKPDLDRYLAGRLWDIPQGFFK